MKRIILTLGAALVLVFGLSVLADAQNRPRPSGGGSGGGGSHATAPARGGGSSAPAPRSGGSGGQSARPRGESAGSGAPMAARPRSGGPVYGTAVPRSAVNYGRIILPNHYYISPYYYSPYAFGAFGLGFWGYDPFWWGGWGYPYYWGWGSPYWGYGYPVYGYGYNYGYYDEPNEAGYGYEQRGSGSVKLKVNPKDAEVYVDGYYVGLVDDFNGTWQHLDLEAGTHRLEIRAAGYQPLVVEMRIEPGRTVTYQNDLKRGQ